MELYTFIDRSRHQQMSHKVYAFLSLQAIIINLTLWCKMKWKSVKATFYWDKIREKFKMWFDGVSMSLKSFNPMAATLTCPETRINTAFY